MNIISVTFFLIIIYNANANVRVKRIVGGSEAAIPTLPPTTPEMLRSTFAPEMDSIVNIFEKKKPGKVIGTKEDYGYSFKGIRYAEPPVGNYKFQRPVIRPLFGVLNAEKNGPPCLQPSKDNDAVVGSEDCLMLNVYTPTYNPQNGSGFPVLFWIHGDGFRQGSGNQYGPRHLVSKQLVVVTVQYRLGSIGWLGATSKHLPGNVGLFDINAALHWTKKYISYFGGDPENIYSAGQGTGASVATLLAQSYFFSGWIRGVIAMSGSPLSSTAVDFSPDNTSAAILHQNRCNPRNNFIDVETVRCLQKMETNELLNMDSNLQNDRLKNGGFVSALGDLLAPGPVVEGYNDGRFLPYFLNEDPLTSLKNHNYPSIPILIGVVKDETSKPIFGNFRDEVLNKLKTIPDFLKKTLPLTLLKTNKGLFSGQLLQVFQELFSKFEYTQLIFSTLTSGLSDIEKVAEATTDALFNLPAVATSSLWKKQGGNAYMYRFEYQSDKPAPQFLSIPSLLKSNRAPENKKPMIGHGDELIFLWDLQTLEGNPIPESELQEPQQLKMRDLFTKAVASFLHNGKPYLAEIGSEWPVFEPETSKYVILSEKPRVEGNFRLCQIALWGGIADTLKSAACNLPGIGPILDSVSGLLSNNIIADKAGSLIKLGSKKLDFLDGFKRKENNEKGVSNGGSLGIPKLIPTGVVPKPNKILPLPSFGGLGGGPPPSDVPFTTTTTTAAKTAPTKRLKTTTTPRTVFGALFNRG